MPPAAVRKTSRLISISGAGVMPAETTIDEARNEMTMEGCWRRLWPHHRFDEAQYDFARTATAERLRSGARARGAHGALPDTFRHARPPSMAGHQTDVFLRSNTDAASAHRATLAMWGELITISWPTRTSLRGTRHSRPPATRLHAGRRPEGEPRHARGESREQRRDEVAPAIRAVDSKR